MLPSSSNCSYQTNGITFKVLLTVHRAMILGNCPTWHTNSFQCIYLFIVLCIFRACHAHHQEKQIVSIQLLVNVTLCWWQCRVLVGSLPPTSTWHCHQHGVTITRSCIDKFVSPDDEHDMLETCRELQINKYIEKNLCVKLGNYQESFF